MNVTKPQVQLIQTALVVVAAVVVYRKVAQATEVVTENAEQVISTATNVVTENLNPVNHENIFNRGFNWLYRKATGSTGTLGTDLAKLTHPTEGL